MSQFAKMMSASLAATLLTMASVSPTYAAGPPIASPEQGVEIPDSVIRLGLKPYADNSFYYIAIKKGWFKDAGIDISPAEGLTVSDQNVNALLLNGELDMSGNYPPLALPTYKTSDKIKQIMFTDVIVAASVLANPKLGLKTYKQYRAEGMDFDGAIKAALAPLNGKRLVAPPNISERTFEEAVQRLSGVQWKLQVMDDSKSLVAAKAGQIDFAHPAGAPIVYSLLQSGWTKIVGMDDLVAEGPSGPDSPVVPAVSLVGTVATKRYVEQHPNTVLRFMSVVWRTIAETKADPALFDLQAPYLNKVAGTALTGTDIAATVKNFHPYLGFDEANRFYSDPTSPIHYNTIYRAIIKSYEDNGILPSGTVKPDDFVWGNPLWQQMVDLKSKTDELLRPLKTASLAPDKQQLFAQAEKYYGWYNFLDAYRLALAASK